MANKNGSKKDMPLISFKIAHELHDQLTAILKDDKPTDDAGKLLSESGLARKIVKEHLEKLKNRK